MKKRKTAKWEFLRLADEALWDAFICSIDSLFTIPLFSLQRSSSARMKIKTAGHLLTVSARGWGGEKRKQTHRPCSRPPRSLRSHARRFFKRKSQQRRLCTGYSMGFLRHENKHVLLQGLQLQISQGPPRPHPVLEGPCRVYWQYDLEKVRSVRYSESSAPGSSQIYSSNALKYY